MEQDIAHDWDDTPEDEKQGTWYTNVYQYMHYG